MTKPRSKPISSFSLEHFNFLKSLASRNDIVGKIINIIVYLLCRTFRLASIIAYKLLVRCNLGKGDASSVNHNDSVFNNISLAAHSVGKSILIIGEFSISGCKTYRIDHKIAMLKYLGYNVKALSWKNIDDCFQALQFCSGVIFYRVPLNSKTRVLVNEAKRLNITTFFEIDDLVFDREEYTRNSNLKALPGSRQSILLDGADQYCGMLKACDHAIASTKTIADYMKKYCTGQIYTINNALGPDLIELANSANTVFKTPGIVTIGYGSGTQTHDSDFGVASDAIYSVLKKKANVRLVIHGFLNLPDEFNELKDQILVIPFLNKDSYYQSLRNFDINIVPLETSVFNDAKSNIKYLEASALNVPSIVSPAASFDCCKDHENALVAETADDWERCLLELIDKPELGNDIAEKAYQTVNDLYHFHSIAEHQVVPFLSDRFGDVEDRRKKVLFVNVLYKPFSMGGATIVVEEIVNQLKQNDDFQPVVFSGFFNDEGFKTPYNRLVRYEVDNVPVFAIHLPEIMSMESDYKNLDYADLFSEVLNFVKPDIVHFHSIQKLGASLANVCIDKEVPYVITLHDCWWLCEKQFMINKTGHYCNQQPIDLRVCSSNCVDDPSFTFERYQYLNQILQGATHLFTPSQFQKELYMAHGLDDSRVSVNENGIVPPQKDFNKSASEKVRFAFLGGNALHKGFFFVKDAFEKINLANYELVVVDLHRKNGLSRISEKDFNIKGKLTISSGFEQSVIDDFYGNVDVLLFPSLWKESFGLTVREAIARNIWVITTDCGGPAEAITDTLNGSLIPMGDQTTFINIIKDIITNPKTFLNRHNDKKIRHFKDQADELVNCYKSFLSDNQ